ncbi:TlpA family protein disulfide reductase [Arcanobacterium hippocoleae]|uniref:TlpA family protein disulfide reductase n=1 Tax=Arcanobacterium hippocoleae TaxID=149017 RepID=UPI00333E36FE
MEVLTVFVGENKQTAQDYLEQTGYRLKSVPDHSSEIARQYGVVGIPAHYFIDPDGVLVDQRVGVLDRSTIGAKLADLIGGKTSAK